MTDTTTPPPLGICFVPTIPPERLVEVACAVEESGLDELWVWEDCFKQSGIASAAVALAVTGRIRVGIGLLPVPLRNVALTAMELATLERQFPGRLIAGVGHGVQSWMDQVGARARSPLTLLEEYAVALRGLLAGETLSTEGEYVRLDQVKLDWPPNPPPPLMIGGDGPKSVAQAARLGDGNLLSAARSTEQITDVVSLVRQHTDDPRHAIVATQIAATGPGARERVDREVPKWATTPAPGIGVAGDAAAIAADVRRLTSLGVTTVVIQPTEDEPDLPGFIRFLGQEVRPLLGSAEPTRK